MINRLESARRALLVKKAERILIAADKKPVAVGDQDFVIAVSDMVKIKRAYLELVEIVRRYELMSYKDGA